MSDIDTNSTSAKAGIQNSHNASTGLRPAAGNETRKDWTREKIAALFGRPFDVRFKTLENVRDSGMDEVLGLVPMEAEQRADALEAAE